MGTRLPLDLHLAVTALDERLSVCRLVSIKDVSDELPARSLTRDEIDRLLKYLADHGIQVIEADAADHLA